MAEGQNSGSQRGLWGVSVAALVFGLVGSGAAWQQGAQMVTLQAELDDLSVALKRVENTKSQPAARTNADRMAAAKAKAKAQGKAGASGAGARAAGPVDMDKRIDAFVGKNSLSDAQSQGLKDIVKESKATLRKLGQDAKAGEVSAEDQKPKMVAELKRRNAAVVTLLGDEIGGKAVKLLTATSKPQAGQAKARQARPGSRLPQ
jgi:hypothetical protein